MPHPHCLFSSAVAESTPHIPAALAVTTRPLSALTAELAARSLPSDSQGIESDLVLIHLPAASALSTVSDCVASCSLDAAGGCASGIGVCPSSGGQAPEPRRRVAPEILAMFPPSYARAVDHLPPELWPWDLRQAIKQTEGRIG